MPPTLSLAMLIDELFTQCSIVALVEVSPLIFTKLALVEELLIVRFWIVPLLESNKLQVAVTVLLLPSKVPLKEGILTFQLISFSRRK